MDKQPRKKTWGSPLCALVPEDYWFLLGKMAENQVRALHPRLGASAVSAPPPASYSSSPERYKAAIYSQLPGRHEDAFPRLVHGTYRYLDPISRTDHSCVIHLGGRALGAAAPQTSPPVWTLLFPSLNAVLEAEPRTLSEPATNAT